jgi:inorganic triphosphatase YgiF
LIDKNIIVIGSPYIESREAKRSIRRWRIELSDFEFKRYAISEHLDELKQALASIGPASTTSTLSTTYYDSRDLKLSRHGLHLEVCEEEGRNVQRFKSNGFAGGSLISCGEWEDVILGDRPDFTAPETGPRLRDAITPDELRPLFKTIMRRTSVVLDPQPATRIEATIDEGEMRDAENGASQPLCEIELELKSGDPTALYDVALRLLDVASLRIESNSKLERGYRLIGAHEVSASAVHAAPAALHDSMTVEAALQAIGRSCIDHLLRNEPAALSGQAEGLHQMRVAVRRLRAALSSVKSMIPDEHYRWASEELRWLAGTLGPARNLDVFAEKLVAPIERALSVEADLKRLTEAVEEWRRAAYEHAKAAITSQRYTAIILRLARWFEVQGWRGQPAAEHAALLLTPIGDAAPEMIERRWRQARKHSRQFRELSLEQRHRLRITLKKLRYTIEFLKELFDEREVKALEKRLKPLQDDLGYMNDFRTAHDLVAEVGRHAREHSNAINRAGGMVLGWHNHVLTELESRLRKDVRRLRRAKPFWPRAAPPHGAAADAPPAQNNGATSGQAADGTERAITEATAIPERLNGAG